MLGTDLYCGLRPLGIAASRQQYQIYCFTSNATAWDTLSLNLIETPPITSYAVGISPLNDMITFLVFQYTGSTATNWQVVANNIMQTGTFTPTPPAAPASPGRPKVIKPKVIKHTSYVSPVKITNPMCGPASPKGCNYYDIKTEKVVNIPHREVK
jgi:hypothetical protein